MLRLLFIQLIWIGSHSAFSQKGDTLRKFLDENIALTGQANSAFPALAIKSQDHWILHAVYPDTSVLLNISFADKALSVRDGDYTLYYQHGGPAQQGMMHKNLAVGNWEFRYDNGQMKDSGMLEDDRMVGTWKSWYKNGQLKVIASYSDALATGTKRTGRSQQKGPRDKSILFDPSAVFFNKEGPSRSWYEQGGLKDSGSYLNDRRNGVWKSWYANGQPESIGAFRQDSLEGEWHWFRGNGAPSTVETYSKNKIVSLACFDETGQATGGFCSILKPPVAIFNRFLDFDKYVLDKIEQDSTLSLNYQGVAPRVKLQYTISKEGQLTKLTILESPDTVFSKAAQRIFRSIEKWSPAISHNRPIEFKMEYTIVFYPRKEE